MEVTFNLLNLQATGKILGYTIKSDSGNVCEECLSHLGKTYKFGEGPLPPFHPNCKCEVSIIWSPLADQVKLAENFFDAKTSLIKKGATEEMITNAINKYYGMNLTWEDILAIGFIDGKGIYVYFDKNSWASRNMRPEDFVGWQIALGQTSMDQKLITNFIHSGNKVPGVAAYTSIEAAEANLESVRLNRQNVVLQKEALESFKLVDLIIKLKGIEAGLDIRYSFRTSDTQEGLIESRAREYGWDNLSEEEKSKWGDGSTPEGELERKRQWLISEKGYQIAPPGGSAHQYGLAIDLYPDTGYIDSVKYYLESNGWKQTIPVDIPELGVKADPAHFEYQGT